MGHGVGPAFRLSAEDCERLLALRRGGQDACAGSSAGELFAKGGAASAASDWRHPAKSLGAVHAAAFGD